MFARLLGFNDEITRCYLRLCRLLWLFCHSFGWFDLGLDFFHTGKQINRRSIFLFPEIESLKELFCLTLINAYMLNIITYADDISYFFLSALRLQKNTKSFIQNCLCRRFIRNNILWRIQQILCYLL